MQGLPIKALTDKTWWIFAVLLGLVGIVLLFFLMQFILIFTGSLFENRIMWKVDDIQDHTSCLCRDCYADACLLDGVCRGQCQTAQDCPLLSIADGFNQAVDCDLGMCVYFLSSFAFENVPNNARAQRVCESIVTECHDCLTITPSPNGENINGCEAFYCCSEAAAPLL